MPAFMSWLVPVGIGIVALLAIIIFLCKIYKVAEMDKALIITGGKEPIIKVSGGSFVIPIFRKADYFDLCMLTVPADSDEIKTKTSVPIVVDWTAQIRPNTKDLNILKKAIVSFKERGNDGIIDDVKLTLMGAVRGVVATLTPEQVQNDKETFKEEIMANGSDSLAVCYQCGTCSGACPSGRRTPYMIRRLVRKALMGMKEAVISDDALWMCTTCYECQERCPRDIKIVEIVKAIRNVAAHEGYMAKAHKMTGSYVAKTGHAVPINDATKALRKEIGLDEVPPTTHAFPEALEEVQKICAACEFDKLIGFNMETGELE